MAPPQPFLGQNDRFYGSEHLVDSPKHVSIGALDGDADPLKQLESLLGYSFRKRNLLERALTHRSFLHDKEVGTVGHYEALEFLGDSILGFVVSEYLFVTYPSLPEGTLTKIKSFLVSRKQLHSLSRRLGAGNYVRLSYGEEKTGGRAKKTILADLFESLVAAIYLDGGLEAARNFILAQLKSQLEQIDPADLDLADYKSVLQEQLHALGSGAPVYQVLTAEGPEHRRRFTVAVKALGKLLGRGTGGSKKEAEQAAAREALDRAKKESARGDRPASEPHEVPEGV